MLSAEVSLTVRNLANEYLSYVEKRRSKSTFVEVRTTFKRLGEFLGPEFKLEGITPAVALRHLDRQMEKRSPNAANKDRKNLATAWKWGRNYLDGFPDKANPFLRVERYPEVPQPRYVPPEEDFWKVFNVSEGQDRVMLATFLYLGARRGEVFRLTWRDVDFRNGRVRLSTKKTATGSIRHDWLPLLSKLRDALLWWWENRVHKESEYVFTVSGKKGNGENQHEGKPFKDRPHFMKTMCKRAEVKPFGFHAIRHLAAVIMYQDGESIAKIQAILRHTNPTTTEKYLKRLGLDPDKLAEAIEGLGKHGPATIIPFPKKEAPKLVAVGG